MIEDFQSAYSEAVASGSPTVTFRSCRNPIIIIPIVDIVECTVEPWRQP